MSWAKRIAWVLVILGIVLVVVWAVRLATVGLSLREHLAQAQAMADDPQSLYPVEACSLVRDLRGDVVTLSREAGGLTQLAPLLGWLPGIGGELRAAPHLLDTADGLTEAGTLTCDALDLESADSGGLSLEVATRQTSRPVIHAASLVIVEEAP